MKKNNPFFFIINIPKYFIEGIGMTIVFLCKFVINTIKYFLWGYVTISYWIYRLISFPVRIFMPGKDERREEISLRMPDDVLWLHLDIHQCDIAAIDLCLGFCL